MPIFQIERVEKTRFARVKNKKERRTLLMAIYHFEAKVISRGKGQSAIASASYRSGEKLYSERYNKFNFYGRSVAPKTFILKPSNAPDWTLDRQKLWNEVEKIEKSKNAQLARDFILALPSELNEEEQEELLLNYCQENFVNHGMVADIAIHRDKDGNPHAHIMTTNRPFKENGDWGTRQKKVYHYDEQGNKIYDKEKKTYQCSTEKTTDWDSKERLKQWRENWAIAINNSLEKKGLNITVTDKSFKEQGKKELPTKHLGSYAHQLELKGLPSENGDINREIKKYNQLLYKQEQLEKENEEKNQTNPFTRHFTPKEKRILSDLSKELNVFISFEKLEDKKRMLNNWKNSALAKQAMTNGQEQEPILSKIKDQKEAVEQAEILLNKEAQRFISAHYPKVNTNALSPYMARELVDKTIHNEQLFDLKETEQILFKSQQQELSHNLSLLLKDPYISVRVMKEKLNKQEAILKTFCAKHDIQLENKESVARQSDEVKKAFQGIIQPLARYEMAIKAVHYYHETTIKEHLPMIDRKQLNGLQKEQLCNAILYFGDQLEEKVVIDVLNDRQPMKYDTATKERLLTGLLEEGHTHLSEIEKQFFENPSMKVMFFNECVQTKDFSQAGKQTLKAVFDKNYTNVKDELNKEKNVEEKNYYRNNTNNFNLLKGLGTNLLFTILRGESEPERPAHKPKKKKHKNDRGYSPRM